MHEQLQNEKERRKKGDISDRLENLKMHSMYGLVAGFAFGIVATTFWKSNLFRKTRSVVNHIRSGRSYKMVLVVRTELGMQKGKIAAQCSHAALGCYKIAKKMTPEVVEEWEAVGQPKIVLKLDTVGEDGLYKLMDESRKRGVASTVIRDAGHTQVERGTATVAGLGPYDCETLDEITGHLKLL